MKRACHSSLNCLRPPGPGVNSPRTTPRWESYRSMRMNGSGICLVARSASLTRAPAAADALVSEAERATRQIPLPFMRIDLYDSHRGVDLGEFTPGPGGLRQFNDEWQARFIRLYREAAAELEAGLRTGAIAPLMPPGSTRPQPVAARK